jgi:hypothetical protein
VAFRLADSIQSILFYVLDKYTVYPSAIVKLIVHIDDNSDNFGSNAADSQDSRPTEQDKSFCLKDCTALTRGYFVYRSGRQVPGRFILGASPTGHNDRQSVVSLFGGLQVVQLVNDIQKQPARLLTSIYFPGYMTFIMPGKKEFTVIITN